jgi:hypothetical protein
MGLTWRATNSLTICSELRARKSGEIEMRLVRLGRNGPGVMRMSGGYRHAGDAESIATAADGRAARCATHRRTACCAADGRTARCGVR